MSDELVTEAFETIEREFTQLWVETSEHDTDGRERVYRMLWAARRFKAFFQHVMEEGQIHQPMLQQMKRGQI